MTTIFKPGTVITSQWLNSVEAVRDFETPVASYEVLRTGNIDAKGVTITSPGITGQFYYDPADSTSADNGGTIIVDSLGRRWKRQFDGPVLLDWFGATGVSPSTDSIAMDNAIAFIVSLGVRGRGLQLSPIRYKFNKGFDIPVSLVSQIIGNGALLDFTALSSGYALKYTGDLDGIKQSFQMNCFYENFRLIGPGVSSNVDAIIFDQANLADLSGPSFSRHSGIGIEGFRNCVTILNNSYLIRFEGSCHFEGNQTGLYLPSGYTNTGEAITMRNCVFSGMREACIKGDSWSADVFLDTCSLEFAKTHFDLSGKIRVDAYGCHLEDNSTSNSSLGLDYKIKVANQASLFIVGGDIYHGVNAPDGQYTHYINCTTLSDVDGGVFIDGAWFYGVLLTSGYLATGSGRVILKHTRGVDFSTLTSTNARSNKLVDGGFESGIRDLISISFDTGITNQFTGSTIAITRSNEMAHAGSWSLKIEKKLAPNTDRSFFIAVPIGESTRLQSDFWINPGTYSGTILMEYGFGIVVNGTNKLDANYFTLDAGYTRRTVDLSTLTGWTEFKGMTRPTPSPAWATHHIVRIRLDAAITGSFFMDSLVINTL